MINEDADSDRTDTTTLEQNAFRLYLQQEQNAANPNNKFNISDYRPSVGDTPEDVYYSIPPQQRKEVYGDNAFPESLSYNGSDFDWKELENKYYINNVPPPKHVVVIFKMWTGKLSPCSLLPSYHAPKLSIGQKHNLLSAK